MRSQSSKFKTKEGVQFDYKGYPEYIFIIMQLKPGIN